MKSTDPMVFRLSLQGRDPGKYVYASLITTPTGDRNYHIDGRLVFRRYGSQYFLSELWQGGSADGVICIHGTEETAILRLQKTQAAPVMKVAINVEPNR
jgi:hypothetical protein